MRRTDFRGYLRLCQEFATTLSADLTPPDLLPGRREDVVKVRVLTGTLRSAKALL
jgi:hypothetical protein